MARPPIYKCDERYFENIDTHEKAYLLGFLWADGHNNPRSGLTVILHKKDEEIINHFKDAMKCNSPTKYRDDYCIFSINRKQIYSDLLNLGMPQNKSKNNLHWPKINPEYNNSFVLGVFDGDGSIYNREKSFAASFANGFIFLEELEKYLSDNAITTNPIRFRYGEDRPQASQLDITGLENLHKLKTLLYKNSSIYMKRKYDKFRDAENKFNEYTITNKRYNGVLSQILEMYKSGEKQITISNTLNIKYSTVRAIIQRDRKKQNENI